MTFVGLGKNKKDMHTELPGLLLCVLTNALFYSGVGLANIILAEN